MSQLDLIKYILFDLDGTIIDTTRLILYTFIGSNIILNVYILKRSCPKMSVD